MDGSMLARLLSERLGSLLRISRPLPPALVLIFIAAVATSLLVAQNPNGALRGEIQDASGARVTGARIVAQSNGSSIAREVTASPEGEFRIEGLLPGWYRVTATANGFAQAAADVDIEVSVVR